MIQNMFRETKMEISFLVTAIVGQPGEWIGIQTEKGLTRLARAETGKPSLLHGEQTRLLTSASASASASIASR